MHHTHAPQVDKEIGELLLQLQSTNLKESGLDAFQQVSSLPNQAAACVALRIPADGQSANVWEAAAALSARQPISNALRLRRPRGCLWLQDHLLWRVEGFRSELLLRDYFLQLLLLHLCLRRPLCGRLPVTTRRSRR
jgi:hypothetical protein